MKPHPANLVHVPGSDGNLVVERVLIEPASGFFSAGSFPAPIAIRNDYPSAPVICEDGFLHVVFMSMSC